MFFLVLNISAHMTRKWLSLVTVRVWYSVKITQSWDWYSSIAGLTLEIAIWRIVVSSIVCFYRTAQIQRRWETMIFDPLYRNINTKKAKILMYSRHEQICKISLSFSLTDRKIANPSSSFSFTSLPFHSFNFLLCSC